MKFKISNIQKSQIQTKYGLKNKLRFTNDLDGKTYDAFEKVGVTDKWMNGTEFNAETNGKPFKGVETLIFPKQGYLPQKQHPINSIGNKWDSLQNYDPSIHAKLDEILNHIKIIIYNLAKPPFPVSPKPPLHLEDQEPDIEQTAPPSDKDFQGF